MIDSTITDEGRGGNYPDTSEGGTSSENINVKEEASEVSSQ
jgi:hypothetical protein